MRTLRFSLLSALLSTLLLVACDKGQEKVEPGDKTTEKSTDKSTDKTDKTTDKGEPAVATTPPDKDKVAATKPVATDAKRLVSPDGWHETRLKEGFRFETVGAPARSTDAASGIVNYQVKTADNHYFMVQTMKMPEFLAGFLGDEKALAAGFAKAEENMLKAMNAKSSKKAARMKVAGMDANEIVANGTQAGQKFQVIARQIVDAKANMLYQMMLMRPGPPIDAAKRDHFFGSFKVSSR